MYITLESRRKDFSSCFSKLRLCLWQLMFAGLTVSSHAVSAPFAFVSLGGSKVAVIDIATNTPIREITVGIGPTGIAADASGRNVYVANGGTNNISVIDAQTGVVSRTLSTGAASGTPFGIAVHPNGSRLYVSNLSTSLLSILDVATGSPVTQIPLSSPRSVAVGPSGNFVYVATRKSVDSSFFGTIAVVDTQQNRVVAEIPASPANNSNILFSSDGSRMYVGEFTAVAVINTSTNQVIGRWSTLTFDSNGFLSDIALSSDGSRLYALLYNDKRLVTFDTSSGAVLSRFTYGNEPTSLVVNSAQQSAILFGERTGLSTTVNLNNGEVVKSYSIGGAPLALGSVVTNAAPAQQQIDNGGVSSGGGGGCGYLSGNGGPPDPTLPLLAMLALLMLGSRGRFLRR